MVKKEFPDIPITNNMVGMLAYLTKEHDQDSFVKEHQCGGYDVSYGNTCNHMDCNHKGCNGVQGINNTPSFYKVAVSELKTKHLTNPQYFPGKHIKV